MHSFSGSEAAMAKAKKYPGVTPKGHGKYRIRTEVRHPKTGRAHEIDRLVHAASAAEAARLLATERAEWLAKRGRSAPGVPRRLGPALAAWLEDKRTQVRPSTASTYASAVAWWTMVLGDYYVDELEPRDVREALAGAREGGDAHDTVSGRLRVLRTFAREERIGGIVEGVRLVRDVRDEERIEDEGRGLSLDELRRFLDAGPTAYLVRRVPRRSVEGEAKIERVDPERWEAVGRAWRRAWALVATMAWTGLRFGEASALEWHDVDLDEGTIRVRRAQWRGQLGHTKAKASKRTVVIPDELVEVLREHRRAMLADQQAGVSSPLVFPSRRTGATYVTNGYVGKSVLRACKAAGIELGERPWVHVLRHTFNNLVRQNASELVRQSLVGHADEEIGARYSAVTAEEKRAAVASVVRMVRGEGA